MTHHVTALKAAAQALAKATGVNYEGSEAILMEKARQTVEAYHAEEGAFFSKISFTCEKTGKRYEFSGLTELIMAFLKATTGDAAIREDAGPASLQVATSPTKLLDPDMPAQKLRLHMGEMTAQEERTARAAIRWANSVAGERGAENAGKRIAEALRNECNLTRIMSLKAAEVAIRVMGE